MAQQGNSRRLVPSSIQQRVPGAVLVGRADPKEVLTVSIRVRQRPDGPPMPDLSTFSATSPKRRTYVSREEFAQSYGAAPTELDQVANFAKGHGLSVVESSAARRTVVVSGTVQQMNDAFGVDLSLYQSQSGVYRSHEGAAAVPAELGDIVESVMGFDNRPLLQPQVRAAASGQAVTPLTPPEVAKLYQFGAGPAIGQTIGIIEFGGGYKISDVQDYFNNVVHLPAPNVSFVGVDGATNSPGGGADIEVILDISVAGSVAPGAKIVVYFAPNTFQGFVDVITTAVHDNTNKPSVLSISWGGGESGWGGWIGPGKPITNAIQEAQLLGVTIFASSGDGGSGSPAEVLYPACDP